MKKTHEQLERELEQKLQRREKKRRTKMRVTGKGVFELQKILKKEK